MGAVTPKLVIPNRCLFPEAFKSLGYASGAEVGVLDGDLSIELVRFGGNLFLVDAWRNVDGLIDVNNPENAVHEARYQKVKARFASFPRVSIRRGLSVDVSKTFQDGELDWVYLDADHRQVFVTADLNAWYPKVRVGGMLAGHDYFNPPGWETHRGVKAAVDEFFKGREVSLTSEFRYEHSWFIIKE
jgi:hypothetical protein